MAQSSSVESSASTSISSSDNGQICSKCEMRADDDDKKRLHAATHLKMNLYQCSVKSCTYTFKAVPDVEKHLRTAHPRLQPTSFNKLWKKAERTAEEKERIDNEVKRLFPILKASQAKDDRAPKLSPAKVAPAPKSSSKKLDPAPKPSPAKVAHAPKPSPAKNVPAPKPSPGKVARISKPSPAKLAHAPKASPKKVVPAQKSAAKSNRAVPVAQKSSQNENPSNFTSKLRSGKRQRVDDEVPSVKNVKKAKKADDDASKQKLARSPKVIAKPVYSKKHESATDTESNRTFQESTPTVPSPSPAMVRKSTRNTRFIAKPVHPKKNGESATDTESNRTSHDTNTSPIPSPVPEPIDDAQDSIINAADNGRIRCQKCQEQVEERDNKDHAMLHSKYRRYNCSLDDCNFGAHFRSTMREHRQDKHPDQIHRNVVFVEPTVEQEEEIENLMVECFSNGESDEKVDSQEPPASSNRAAPVAQKSAQNENPSNFTSKLRSGKRQKIDENVPLARNVKKAKLTRSPKVISKASNSKETTESTTDTESNRTSQETTPTGPNPSPALVRKSTRNQRAVAKPVNSKKNGESATDTESNRTSRDTNTPPVPSPIPGPIDDAQDPVINEPVDNDRIRCVKCQEPVEEDDKEDHAILHSNYRRFNCSVGDCNFGAHLYSTMREHREVKHQNDFESIFEFLEPSAQEQEEIAKLMVECFGNDQGVAKKKKQKKKVRCNLCGIFASVCSKRPMENIRRHAMTHITFRSYKCDKCDFETHHYKSALSHPVKHGGEWCVNQVMRTVNDKQELTRFRNLCFPEFNKDKLDVPMPIAEPARPRLDIRIPVSQPSCSVNPPTPNQVEIIDIVDDNEVAPGPSNPANQQVSAESQQTTCQLCHLKKFNTHKARNEHVFGHANIMRYACGVKCGYLSNNEQSIRNHEKDTHGYRPRKILENNRTADEIQKLNRMMQECFPRKHVDVTGTRCIKCKMNGVCKIVEGLDNQIDHSYQHLDFNIYKCTDDDCDFESKTEEEMEKHEKSNPYCKIELSEDQQAKLDANLSDCFM